MSKARKQKPAVVKRLCRIGKGGQERVVTLQRIIQTPDILERDGAGK